MEIAIVVGHTKLRQGACSPHDIQCEWAFNKALAEELSDIADIYYYDSYNLGYKSMVKRNAVKMNKQDYKLVIELHYNAASPSANGCEALYYFRNKKTKKLAEEFCRMYVAAIGGKNRGAKALVSKRDRGFWAVFYPTAPTIILEPFFGTNKKDVERLTDAGIKEYEYVIRRLISKLN
jgi:N-acetylmuramoyl-L-alanine amidase